MLTQALEVQHGRIPSELDLALFVQLRMKSCKWWLEPDQQANNEFLVDGVRDHGRLTQLLRAPAYGDNKNIAAWGGTKMTLSVANANVSVSLPYFP